MPKVISFSSGKGGVGKTTLVANLGTLWARQGRRTLLIDGDWALGKLGIMLGVRTESTIEKVLSGQMSLSSAIVPVSQNLSLLASPSGLVGFEELSHDQRIRLFYEIESLSDYDLVLLDHSSGIHWGVLQFAAPSHQHVIVTTSEPTSYTDAYAIMKVLSKRFRIRDFFLVVSQSMSVSQARSVISRFCDVARNQLEIRLKVLDILPWEPKLALSILRQKAFVSLYPEHAFSEILARLCGYIERSETRASHGLRFFQYSTEHRT